MFDLIPIGSIGEKVFDEVVIRGTVIASVGYDDEKRDQCRAILTHAYNHTLNHTDQLKAVTDALVTIHKLGWAEVINIQDVIYNGYGNNFDRIKKIKEIESAKRKII